MIKIIIADDHPMLRSGMIQNINKEVDMKVVLEAESGEELLSKLDNQEFDVVILDIGLPGRSGLEILKDIRKLYPKVPVLMYSGYQEDRYGLRAIQAGANGYISKEDTKSNLIDAIRKIKTGKKYITPELAEILANEVDKDIDKLPHERLSDREFEIMRHIALGKSVSQIADLLSISVNTVNTYRARILQKMGMNSNTQIALYALENNILD
ncbi:MAG: response regulator transcription factor [Melioribacteraceae bacterium]|jgi:DNA-binding NarL/FixJ family response regulator|nr:response regulator transcription factor [Melioribacteraceae bacterium]